VNRAGRASPWLAVPALGWFAWFLLAPLAFVLVYSFGRRGTYGGIVHVFSTENYERVVDPIYLRVFWHSLKLAAITAASCLALGYPMAYVMATARPRLRSALLVLVVVPFWTNFVVRTYALKAILAENGPLNHWLISLGLISEPFEFAGHDFAIWLGMLTNYLPFMVLPLYVSLEKFDFSLLDAAQDLGASRRSQLYRILIPLTRHGIVTGLIFVFTPALGEFVIPDMLGGARVMLIGNLITDQFLRARDWPFGSALSLLLIGLVMATLLVYYIQRYVQLGQRRKPA
jgi:spermidine/putrescine transport system permease protein